MFSLNSANSVTNIFVITVKELEPATEFAEFSENIFVITVKELEPATKLPLV